MNILVSGLINIETTLKIREFPIHYYPIDYPFFGINTNVAGVALNVSKALKTLNNNITLASIQATDFDSERILNEIKNAGIDTKYIKRELTNSPTSIILYDDSGRRQIYCDLKDIQDRSYENEELEEELNHCDIAIICNINFNRNLLKKAKAKNRLIATDVHVLSDIHDEYNKDFLENADILFLSDEKIPCDHREFIYQLKDTYHSKIIVLGRGSKGAMMYVRDEDRVYDVEAVSVGPVVNTIGAGDSLLSGFIHFYGKGYKPIEALKRAEVFASYKIGFSGAAVGFLDEDSLEEIYRGVNIIVR